MRHREGLQDPAAPMAEGGPETVFEVERATPGPSLERKRLQASCGVLTLGADPDADLVLFDPSASRWQARFVLERGAWWVEDLGSRVGTELTGRRVRRGRHRLRPGDVVRVPGAVLQWISSPAEAPDGAPNERRSGAAEADRGALDTDEAASGGSVRDRAPAVAASAPSRVELAAALLVFLVLAGAFAPLWW